jgi:hypothetical protein
MKSFFLLLLALSILGCQPEKQAYAPEQASQERAVLIHQLNRALIGVVSEDLFTPPVASRIYAYTNIAAYEAARRLQPGYRSMAGQLNGLPPLPEPQAEKVYWEIAMLKSYCETAKHLVYRDFMVDSIYQVMTDSLRPQYPSPAVFEASEAEGAAIAAHITAWADEDGYNDTRNMPRYEPRQQEYAWEATAPTYGEALEPHWFKLRPFAMDSASQFRAELPVPFSKEPDSDFYRAAEKVYKTVQASSPDDIDVAVYWDCNPGPTMVDGHLMQVRKQNTPGGHWLGIHSILAESHDKSLAESCAVYAKLCPAIADAFIAAWDTKYAHNLLRPETYINRYMDPDWQPKLESPLFPEYTSAHSLVSGAAASVLSAHYGDADFYDDTNLAFGLPPRRFNDVWEAAEEAARSRLLGGIHYAFGCEDAFEQGKKLGQLVNDEVTLQD